MAKDATDVRSRLRLRNAKDDQTIALMAESSIVEVVVVREQGRSAEPEQERDDVLVGESLLHQAVSEVAHRDSPCAQQLTLIGPNVLVEDIHTVVDSWT